ncbi:MAG: SprB repeat-containing protein, partial [Lentisphaeria bacterium]|nr:SprB repeat-containing protein [Lentisphaeria bacterium]
MRYLVLIITFIFSLNSFSQVTAIVTAYTDVICNGDCNGTATVTGTGGSPYSFGDPYTYIWTPSGQTTQSVTGLCAGTYMVTVTDSLGVSAQDTVVISQYPVLTAAITSSIDVSCFGMCDGSASVLASGGTGGNYMYTWDDPFLQLTQTVTGLCAGVYQVIAIDTNGCLATDTIVISEPPLLTVSITTTDDTCGLCVGTADAIVTGGSTPYTYVWSQGSTGNPMGGLCAGNYTLLLLDVNGCVVQDGATINFAPASSCGWGMINGKVYKDDNANCNQDTLEIGLANVMIQATPGPYFASTDVNGDYTLILPFGNYTVTQVAQPFYHEICPVAGSYSVILDTINNTLNNNDFGDTITSAQEISISLISGTPRPWFSFSYYISYTSISSSPTNGTVYLVVDDTLTYQYASVTPDLISGDTLFWNYTNLQQFENRNISATFLVPGQVGLLGDSLQACAEITPIVGDVNSSNNTSCVSDEIVGSYDPNDKQVTPTGVGPTGDILLSDTQLNYKIRFQNSGTFLATNVVVVDTLSANLDVTSLRDVVASHPFVYSVDGQGVLTFTFNNIMLPDSNTDEPGSHGMIQFV